MNYLIGLDLDGTLLTDKKEISSYNKKIISDLIKEGHKVFLVTGRSYDGAINYYNELKLNTPLITLNGALTTYSNKNIKTYFNNDFMDLYRKVDHFVVSALFNSYKLIYTKNHDKELEKIFNGNLASNYEVFDLNKDYNDILNAVVVIEDSKRHEFEKMFEHELYKARYWGTYNDLAFYDIHMNNISKASAINEMMKELNIELDKLITIGDGVNDLEMLKMTKNGTAMKNATLDVKMFASNTTKYDNENDGVGKHLFSILTSS